MAAETPDVWTGRLLVSLVIGAMAMGIFLVLQLLMGLLITAVAVQILVNGLKACFPILA